MEVVVGLVDEAGAALALEVIEDVGQRCFFEDVVTYDKRFR